MSATMAVVAPVAGLLSGRIGGRRLMAAALWLSAGALAWLAAAAGAPYPVLVPGLAFIGAGAACLFVPIQATLLGAVEPARQGQASGAAVAFRELGGVLGVAVLASVFSAHGSVASPGAFVAGARPAFAVAAGVAAAAALLALGLRARVAAPLRRPVLAE
jgi:MFS family permease